MIAISVKQPWASLIVHGIKDIENRTWMCPQKYIGKRVLIHASKERDKREKPLLTDKQYELAGDASRYGTHIFGDRGANIGSVKIVSCVQNHPSVWAEKGVFNWVLSDPILFDTPIPAKGKLGFWNFPNINSEEDEVGRDVCCCNLGIPERQQILSYGNGDYRCKYCGGKWYK